MLLLVALLCRAAVATKPVLYENAAYWRLQALKKYVSVLAPERSGNLRACQLWRWWTNKCQPKSDSHKQTATIFLTRVNERELHTYCLDENKEFIVLKNASRLHNSVAQR